MGLAALGVRFAQRQSIDTVSAAELDVSSSALNRLGSHQKLSLKLAMAETRLEELDTLFPTKLSGPSTVSQLIRMAERSNLSVSDIETQPGTAEELGDHVYRRMSIQIQLQGTLTSLRSFLLELEEGAIPASRIDHLNIGDVTFSPQPDGSPNYSLEIGLLLSLFSRDFYDDFPRPTTDAADAPAPAGGS